MAYALGLPAFVGLKLINQLYAMDKGRFVLLTSLFRH